MGLISARVKREFGADLSYLALFVAFTLIVTIHRAHFDWWLTRHDILTQFLPWYTYLGERLRELQIPGWNPHLDSGAPFAGDAQSGWMYFPAMVTFPFFNPLFALKAMIGVQLVIAGLSTYGLARALKIGPAGAAAAAVIFTFGPLLNHTTSCCTARGNLAPWIPVALLGIELGIRAPRWPLRILPMFLAGFGMSQMFAGFFGQGAMDGLLVVASYVVYRSMLAPPNPTTPFLPRIVTMIVVGGGSLAACFGLGAAGIAPRITAGLEMEISQGYDVVGGYTAKPPSLDGLFQMLLGNSPSERSLAVGGAAFILFFLGIFFAGRRHCVPYFAAMSIVTLTLSMAHTPLHTLFDLIPRYRDLHDHYAQQTTAILMIGPAIVSGAAVQAISTLAASFKRLILAIAPFLGMIAIERHLKDVRLGVDPISAIAGGLITLLVVATLIGNARIRTARMPGNIPRLAALSVVVVAFVLPTGTEMASSFVHVPYESAWSSIWTSDPAKRATAEISVSRKLPDTPAEFLQQQLLADGPFRYVSYSGYGFKAKGGWKSSTARRLEPNVLAIVANARAIPLGLYDAQTYNPSQLLRYAKFIEAINNHSQDYHTSYLAAAGINSNLSALLNIKYVLIDRSIAADRADIVSIAGTRKTVYQDRYVTIVENPAPPAVAWVVHDVAASDMNSVLNAIKTESFDPAITAMVEGPAPATAKPAYGAADSTKLLTYEPEDIRVQSSTSANGLLVFGEVYENGWRAYVDGKPVAIVLTDYAFRGVPIAAGSHVVELRYESRSLRYGLWLSASSMFAWLAVGLWRGRTRLRDVRNWFKQSRATDPIQV